MSERSTFVTDYIYCEKCFEEAKKILLCKDKYLCSTTIPPWNDLTEKTELPIIAGKIGGLYPGDDYYVLKSQLIPKLENSICHKMRIAALFDNGHNEIFEVYPKN